MRGRGRPSVGSDREPVAIFTGEAVHEYLGRVPDKEIEAMLNDLAVELGAALGRSASMWRSATEPGFSTRASVKHRNPMFLDELRKRVAQGCSGRQRVRPFLLAFLAVPSTKRRDSQ